MDFCSYVNSTDIGNYLREIGYEFNSKEAAWLINQCHSLSVKEKHEAWEQLMQEMPDYNLGERFSFLPGNSLYELIRRNIKYQEKEYELFNKKEADTVYHYRFYCYSSIGKLGYYVLTRYYLIFNGYICNIKRVCLLFPRNFSV